MIRINHIEETAPVTLLEVGDILLTEDGTYLQFIEVDFSRYGLLNVEESTIATLEINHPKHALNHVSKHYGDFEIIKSDRVSLNIEKR